MLVDELLVDEGLKLRPYVDTVGKITIGVGRNLTDRGITSATALDWLAQDIAECQADLATFGWWLTLDGVRCRALLNLRFNLGPNRFRTFKKMLAAIECGDFETAATELDASAWATQVQPSRRTRLIRQLRTAA